MFKWEPIHNQQHGALKANLLLLIVIIVLFFLNSYNQTLTFRPSSIHQWRQTDCLSIAKNYYEEGMNFFQPKIHFQGPKEGRAVSELPVLNYTAALLWKIFGEKEIYYRLIGYILYLLAIFTLFNTLVRNKLPLALSFLVLGFSLSSPLITYYCINFIADVPGLSLAVISFCMFYQFYSDKQTRFFYLSLIVASLAVLIKASALIPLILILFFSFSDILGLNTLLGTEKLFKNKLLPTVFLIASPLLIFLWYLFALRYNANNSNDIFLLRTLPIWEMNYDEIVHASKVLFNIYLFPWFLNKPMFFLFVVGVLFTFANFKKLDSFLRYAFLFSVIYFVLFIVMFFQVFNLHDYYLVNLMICPVITFICVSKIVLNTEYFRSHSKFIRLTLALLFVFNSFNCAAMYRLRAVPNDEMAKWAPFVSEDEINLANYIFWDYWNAYGRIENFGPELRKHGIKRDDLILSMPDGSFNISLYFMDSKGYTAARDHIINDSTVLDRFLKKKIKYVVLSDTTLRKEKSLVRFEKNLEPFFIKDNVKVYRLKQAI